MTIEVIKAPVLAGTRHGFLGRTGGVSTGTVSGLNVGLGSNDSLGNVTENRRLAAESVAPECFLATVYQTHSADAVTVTAPFSDDARPNADALVTDRPGILLGIVTADCAPILLADTSAGVVGAAHAGWKGALNGVTDTAIAAMEKLGARRERIAAAIGPCIARISYEVDEAFRRRFAAADATTERFFADGRRAGHFQFDIEAYVVHRLAAVGVTKITALGLDTYSQPQRFFSYRRATHAGEPDYGRQISLIALS